MVTQEVSPELDALVEQAARARVYFSEYAAFVHDWEVRPHQRRAYSALQALADGRLIAKDHTLCSACREVEERWIQGENLPYEGGFRVSRNCKVCPTTNKLLWLAFFGSGKTDSLVEWLTWMIGRDTVDGNIPQAGWVSYADDVADLRSVAIRDTIEFNKRFQFVFPDAKPDKKKGWGEGEWFLKRSDPGKKDPTLRAAGISGAILAYRFLLALVFDDPQDPIQVKSETYREDTWKAITKVAMSRATEDVTPIVMISNRWAEDDAPGRIMALLKDWQVVLTPALNEQDESVFPAEVHMGQSIGKSTEALHKLREQDRPSFLTGYMCQPPSADSNFFNYFALGQTPNIADVVKCVQFWDTTTTTKSYSDYNAMSEKWKLKNGRAYSAKNLNRKMGPNETLDAMMNEYNRAENEGLRPVIVIENAHAGPAFHAMLQRAGYRSRLHVLGGFGAGSKRRGQVDLVTRAAGVVGQYEGGIVYYPSGTIVANPWLEETFTQMRSFPNAQHDDIVSAEVGAIEYLYPHSRRGRPTRTFEVVRVAGLSR